jgi:5'-3' exoribonuclease 2
MGVPAFYRWLARTFPKIQRPVQRDPLLTCATVGDPSAYALPNPNGVEIDSLLIDANGVLHNCSHPEDRPPPRGDEEMFAEIFRALGGCGYETH